MNDDPTKTVMENQQIFDSELVEINSIPAVYANKHYIMQSGPLLKIVMCEKSPDIFNIKARAAITFTIQDFFAFSDMVLSKRQEIEEQLKSFQK